MGKLKNMVIGFICLQTMTLSAISISASIDPRVSDFMNSMVNKLAGRIDNTDLKNEQEVQQLTTELNEWGELLDGQFERAHLERVVDGDTIVVDIEGEQYKVRLIGVNTPESVASDEYLQRSGKENTEEGKLASDYVKEVLANTDVVFLQMDKSEVDKYDRLLRYVWLELPDDQWDAYEIETKMLNAMLIEDNMAAVEIYKPDNMYEKQFYDIAEKSGNTLTEWDDR